MYVNGLVLITLGLLLLQRLGFLKEIITRDHYHDLGKLIFAFSIFWGYIWISQYLLIWYANIPEEIAYFTLRERNDWAWLFYLNLFINLALPFLILLPRGAKRNKSVLLKVCLCLLIGRWLDLYLMMAPPILEHAKIENPEIGFSEVFYIIGLWSFIYSFCCP